MKVEVRPLVQDKWHGKKNREAFFEPKTIQVLYDPSTGAYATGLRPDREQELTKKLGVDLSNTFTPDKEHPFWASKAAQIKLVNTVTKVMHECLSHHDSNPIPSKHNQNS